MMKITENEARVRGYLKLFVETYQNSTFEKAIKFYSRQGFSKAGSVLNYLPDNSDMIVFSKML